MDDKYKNHPSFATLYIGRSFCSGKQNLFGSSIKHNEVITLRINPASISRNLNNDYIFSDPNSYIEINMSQAQFAQAITSFNMGDGTPVTLRKLNDQYIEPCPYENKRIQFTNELSEELKVISNEIEEVSKATEELIENKRTFNKADKEKILNTLHKVQGIFNGNLSYIYSQFNKQMDKTVTEAKAEVEGHIKARIDDMASRGIDLISKQDTLPEISAADDTGGEDEDMGMNMGGM